MPLGFARSVLTASTGTVASPDKGYWALANTLASNLYKGITFTKSTAYSNTSANLDVSFWFKGNIADLDTAFDSHIIFVNSDGVNNTFTIEMHKNYGLFVAQFYGSYGGESITSHQNTTNNFGTTYLNNAWHHCYVQWRGRANNNALSRIYLDGVDTTYSKNAGTMPIGAGSQPIQTASKIFHNGNKDKRASGFRKADFYQIFHSTTNNIANISKWYNAGYVDLGTSGNSGGAPTPDIWLTVSGGAVTQGGALSGTVSEVGDGTLTKSNTGGPGA
jgi:hypothetical protein